MKTPEEFALVIADECLEGHDYQFYYENAADLIRARDVEMVAKALRKAAHGLDHARTYRVSDIKALLYGRASEIERGIEGETDG